MCRLTCPDAHPTLPPALAKQWRLAVTLAFQAIPAMDPSKDDYLVRYEPPACSAPAPASKTALLITGGTGWWTRHCHQRGVIGAHVLLLLRSSNNNTMDAASI